MHSNVLLQLAIVLTFASAIGFITHKLKFPLLVAYLLSGVVISALSFFNLRETSILTFFPEIGIAFVLFLVGMELDLREIKNLGLPIIVTSLGQIIISTIAGFAIAGYLGFTQTESIYIGLGLSFSSTIVIIKILMEKRDLASLYGKLSLGITLVEDLVAVVALMVLTVSNSVLSIGLQQNLPILALFIKGLGLFILTFILSKYVLEKIFTAVARSVELLFLTALTWCFVFTSLSVYLGFSIVIGAFLAGIALASSSYHLQIQGKIKPLRDFFVTLFFVFLGAQVRFDDVISSLPIILALVIYALFIKQIIFLLILGVFGFRKHTLFQTALNLSQISEFSLLILLIGLQVGVVGSKALSVMALVGVTSIVISSILITYSKRIYHVVEPFLGFFEHSTRIHFLESKNKEMKQDHIVVIGAHRIGGPVVRYLKKEGFSQIVLDFNPHIIEDLNKKGIEAIYGDVGDPDILDYLQLETAKLILSTATDLTDNEILLEECKRKKVKARKVVRALDSENEETLKKLGADYVILPENVSAEFLVNKLKTSWL